MAALLSFFQPAVARADDAQKRALDAQALYDRAMVLLDQRRDETACRLFQEAETLLPDSTAVSIAVAECHLSAGRLATALSRYTRIKADAAARGERARVEQARARLDVLRTMVARLTVMVPDNVKALPGLEIRCDGELLDASQMGVAMPIDRGSHEIEVTATGKSPLLGTAEIDEDGKSYIVGVTMPNDLVPKAPPPPPPLPPRPPVKPAEKKGSMVPGIVVLSGGATALGIGLVTGAVTLSTASGLKATCQDNLCPPSQEPHVQKARGLGAASTAELVVGSAMTTLGAVLLALRPFGRGGATASVKVGPGAVSLTGRF